MNVTLVKPSDFRYPVGISGEIGDRPTIAAFGNLDLLNCQPLGLFCSIKCPGDVILRLYDFVRGLRDAAIPVIGGFHSPMEKECLTLLLRGSQPVVACPARSIDGMRIPAEWKQPLAENRFLVVSTIAQNHRRVTADTSAVRNVLVANLAGAIIVAYAEPGGKTEKSCREIIGSGKTVFTMDCGDNAKLIELGAKPVSIEELIQVWPRACRPV